MSNPSSWATESDVDSESDSIEDSSQFLALCQEKDPKWDELFSDDDQYEFKPRTPIEERFRLQEEKEKELIKKARARGIAKIPDDYVPPIEVVRPEESEEARAERYKAWDEKQKRIQREKEEMKEIYRKMKRAEYEKYAKLQKEYHTRDYYWKPDPLYYLHLKELGYSKIAIDKALFYTDNKSVARAVAYLKENPNPTELTKEEVMAAGEEVLKRIRPVKRNICDQTEQISPKDGEMEIEEASQALLPDDDCSTGVTNPDDSSNQEMKEPGQVHEEVTFVVSKDVGIAQEELRRGIKRTHSGEEVKSFPTTSTIMAPQLPTVKESPLEYKMIFLINTSLLMDAITLSLEVGKVVANITNKMRDDSDEHKKMFDEWIKEGYKMSMYKGNDCEHLSETFKWTSEVGLLTYLGQCSHYRDVKTPSSTVLGIFGDNDQLHRFCNHLPML